MSNIKSITPIGKAQTYDLEVGHKDHQFYLANGLLTSNSHSVSYAIDSYYAAWLHTHYEKDWLATILQSANSNPKELAKTISEIKALGFKFSKIDVNYSGKVWEYSAAAEAFVPPLTSVKGIGGTAVDEIVQNRPYIDLTSMLYDADGNWRHTKVNKTAFAALCKIDALESLDDFKTGRVNNHRQLLTVLTEEKNYETLRKGLYGLTASQIKKKTKAGEPVVPILDSLLESTSDIEDWERAEKIGLCFELTSTIDADILFPPELMEKINKLNIPSIHDIAAGEEGIGWFCAQSAEVKKTKNGKIFYRCKAVDEQSRSAWVRIWGSQNETIEPYTLWVGKVSHDANWGYSSTIFKLRQMA